MKLCQACKERKLYKQKFKVSSYTEQVSLIVTILNISLGKKIL